MRKHSIFALFSVFILTAGLWAAKVTNRSVAVVNGESVLLSEFEKNWEAFQEQQKTVLPPEKMDEAWAADARQKILDQMVDDRLLLQEAKKRKIRVNQREFENGRTQVKGRFLPKEAQRDLNIILRRQAAAAGPEAGEEALDFPAAWKELEKSNPKAVKEADAEFAKQLNKEGIDAKKFEERIKDQLSVVELSKRVVRERVTPPTEEETKALFKKIMAIMDGKTTVDEKDEASRDLASLAKYFKQQTGERVRARHILISVPGPDGGPGGWGKATPDQKAKARKEINKLRQQIVAGGDFIELAEKHSMDKGSAANGGDLGFFTRGQMVPPFEQAAFGLPVGKVSEIVETPFGLHLIRVEEKKASTKLRLEDIEDDLQEYLLRSRQQEAFEGFVADLRKSAQIKINDLPKESAKP